MLDEILFSLALLYGAFLKYEGIRWIMLVVTIMIVVGIRDDMVHARSVREQKAAPN